MTARLTLHELHRVFANGDGLHGVSLTVEPAEIHAIVGLNGAGKSTLMRLALGMSKPDSGTVTVGNVRLSSTERPPWGRVGHLVEYPFAYPELTVRQNLLLAARLHGMSRAGAHASVAAAIDELDLGRYATRKAGALSLGNKQRVGLASAIQHPADLIVLDEPSNALDPSGVILLRAALEARAATGTGILVSSHHLDEVARVAHRITVINNGRLVGQIAPDGIDIERRFFDIVRASEEPT
jgi:ABC-2 type transport system ATP-binding protein